MLPHSFDNKSKKKYPDTSIFAEWLFREQVFLPLRTRECWNSGSKVVQTKQREKYNCRRIKFFEGEMIPSGIFNFSRTRRIEKGIRSEIGKTFYYVGRNLAFSVPQSKIWRRFSTMKFPVCSRTSCPRLRRTSTAQFSFIVFSRNFTFLCTTLWTLEKRSKVE